MNESRFYMWRAVFAMAHADRVVTAEEKSFLYKVLGDHDFSAEQRAILEADIDTAQDIGAMFSKIASQDDRSKFFYYARALVWCDGDFGEQEQKIMIALRKSHVETVDFDAIGDTMDFELDESERDALRAERARIAASEPGPKNFWQRLFGK